MCSVVQALNVLLQKASKAIGTSLISHASQNYCIMSTATLSISSIVWLVSK
jgi:hypothetical protein